MEPRIVNCLTFESKKNLSIIESEKLKKVNKEYLLEIDNGLNILNEYIDVLLKETDLLKILQSKPYQILSVITKSYDPNIFLNSNQNSMTNIQKNTLAYQKFIKINTQSIYAIKYVIVNLSFKLNFYYDNKHNNIQEIIQSIINRLHLIIITFANKIDTKLLSKVFSKTNEYLEADIYLYDFNRNIDIKVDNNKLESLDYYKKNNCSHCSSGYSNSTCVERNNQEIKINTFEIVCTRIPEALGLFTHEMFHVLHLDTRYFISKEDRNNIKLTSQMLNSNDLDVVLDKFNDKVKSYQFLETFNNTTTTIFHSLFNAIELSASIDHVAIINLFKKLMQIEVIYSIFHSVKILHNQNFNTFASYFDKEKTNYYQLAYLYEYTIVRSFMFMNMIDYVEYMKFKDTNSNFNGNNKGQITDATIMVTKLLDKTFKLMYEDKSNNVRIKYSQVFDKLVEVLDKQYGKESSNNIDVCGSINMEYFCIDHRCSLLQNGGRNIKQKNLVNYCYKKYRKYKLKYYQING